jgi:hypothetical protein
MSLLSRATPTSVVSRGAAMSLLRQSPMLVQGTPGSASPWIRPHQWSAKVWAPAIWAAVICRASSSRSLVARSWFCAAARFSHAWATTRLARTPLP